MPLIPAGLRGKITGCRTLVQTRWTALTSGSGSGLHTHDAGDTTTGTFADARIAESNVTNHEAAIDHDALTNYVANEHVNWVVTGAEDVHVDRVAAGAVTQHVASIDHDSLLNFAANEHFTQAAISITGSQVSDFATYVESNIASTGLSDIDFTPADNDVMYYTSGAWVAKAVVASSAGGADSGKIARLDASGLFDPSFISAGFGLDTGGPDVQVDVATVGGLGDPASDDKLGILLESSNPSMQIDGSNHLGVKLGNGLTKGSGGCTLVVAAGSGITVGGGGLNSDNSILAYADGSSTISGDWDFADYDITDVGVIGVGSSFTPDSNAAVHIQASAGAAPTTTAADLLQIEKNGDVAMQFVCPGTNSAYIGFSDGTRNVGNIQYNHTSNQLTLRANSNPGFHISSAGYPFFYGRAAGGGTDAYLLGTGELVATTSTRRDKENITDLDFDWNLIYTMPPPVSFDYIMREDTDREPGKGRCFGWMAEEIELVIPSLVGYKDFNYDPEAEPGSWEPDWKPNSINYASVVPLLVEAIKELNTRIDLLESLARGPGKG